MEYNTKRAKLNITDYGRNVYNMIQYAKTVKDRTMRTQIAYAIVKMMGDVNPKAKDNDEWDRKLWDHMMILSDWELDVDCPYELTRKETIHFVPHRLNHKHKPMIYRHYGRCLEDMIVAVSKMEASEERDLLNVLLTAQMKKSYLMWNRDIINNDIIENQMRRISGGAMDISNVEVPINVVNQQAANEKKAAIVNNNNKKKKKKSGK